MRRALRLGLAAALLVAAGGYACEAAADEGPPPLGPGHLVIEVGIHHSLFDLEDLRVYEGTLVEFVVVNHDPIYHELVVGDEEVHRIHEAGHEHRHPPVPGEVSVGPWATGVTTYLFDEPGQVRYACHLPGHVAHGMEGTIEVVPRR